MNDRREEIVAAALDVIADEGLGSFTQPRVARRTGLRQSHITYYFPTRDDLLFAVAKEAVRRRIDALRAVLTVDEPQEKIAVLARVLTAPEQARMLVALVQAADRHDEVRSSFDALGAGVAPLSAALLESFGIAVDADALMLLQATSTGIAVLSLARGPDFIPLAEHLLGELLERLVARRPETAQEPEPIIEDDP